MPWLPDKGRRDAQTAKATAYKDSCVVIQTLKAGQSLQGLRQIRGASSSSPTEAKSTAKSGCATKSANHYSPIINHAAAGPPNSLGAGAKPCYGCPAFVALVTPLDSMKGLQVHTCGLFCFTAGGGRE